AGSQPGSDAHAQQDAGQANVPDDSFRGFGPVTFGQPEESVAQNAHDLLGWHIDRTQCDAEDQAEDRGDRQTNEPGERTSSLALDAQDVAICVHLDTLAFLSAKMVARRRI